MKQAHQMKLTATCLELALPVCVLVPPPRPSCSRFCGLPAARPTHPHERHCTETQTLCTQRVLPVYQSGVQGASAMAHEPWAARVRYIL